MTDEFDGLRRYADLRSYMKDTDPADPPDPVDEMKAVLSETLRANDLELWSASGAHVFNSDTALDGLARGLLARKVAEPSAALASSPAGSSHFCLQHACN